jgi:hypothetical protein
MGVDTLPPANDDELIVKLLTETEYRSARDTVWRSDEDGLATAAPTTQASFHIVPARYDGGFVPVNRESCARCHETVSQHVNRFQPGRDWYGRIRGSDGIFSFHPFALSSISHNGFGQSIQMRQSLVEGGVVARFDEDLHPSSRYSKTVRFAPSF